MLIWSSACVEPNQAQLHVYLALGLQYWCLQLEIQKFCTSSVINVSSNLMVSQIMQDFAEYYNDYLIIQCYHQYVQQDSKHSNNLSTFQPHSRCFISLISSLCNNFWSDHFNVRIILPKIIISNEYFVYVYFTLIFPKNIVVAV